MKANTAKQSATIAATLSALLFILGCPPPPPPPTAVLEGTWELQPTSATISDFLITFDLNGEITRIEYTHTASVGSPPVSVTINDPDFVNANSSVSGSDVEITASWAAVNNFLFSGTLNEAQDQIDGTIQYFIVVGNAQVSLPSSDARLTKQ